MNPSPLALRPRTPQEAHLRLAHLTPAEAMRFAETLPASALSTGIVRRLVELSPLAVDRLARNPEVGEGHLRILYDVLEERARTPNGGESLRLLHLVENVRGALPDPLVRTLLKRATEGQSSKLSSEARHTVLGLGSGLSPRDLIDLLSAGGPLWAPAVIRAPAANEEVWRHTVLQLWTRLGLSLESRNAALEAFFDRPASLDIPEVGAWLSEQAPPGELVSRAETAQPEHFASHLDELARFWPEVAARVLEEVHEALLTRTAPEDWARWMASSSAALRLTAIRRRNHPEQAVRETAPHPPRASR